MKKIAFLALCFGTLTLAFCTNNPKNETAGERLDNEIDTLDYQVSVAEEKAKVKVDQAQKDLKNAIARGDKKAEELARKTLASAEAAWEKTKKVTREATKEVKDAANETVYETRKAIDSVDSKAERIRKVLKD